ERVGAGVATARERADVAHGGGVRARGRAGERQARKLLAAREARQIVALLLGGAVFLDQLAQAPRGRDHEDGEDGGRARGDLAENEGERLRREAEAAVLLGDAQAEKAVLPDEAPDRLGDLPLVVPDLPVIDQPAQLIGLTIEERLLLGGEDDGRH